MELIPAISLLVVFLIISVVLILKFSSEQLLSIFSSKNFLLIAVVGLFLILVVVHLFESQTWTADILKVVAGVLVGVSAAYSGDSDKKDTGEGSSSVGIGQSTVGDNAKIAGRDINETIEHMQGDIQNLKGNLEQITNSVIHQYNNIENSLAQIIPSVGERELEINDYLINTLHERFYNNDLTRFSSAMQKIVNRWREEGWAFHSISSDYNGLDGMVLIFSRPSRNRFSEVIYSHGSQMEIYKND